MNKIQQAIDNLENVLREHSADTVTTFNVFINCEGREVKVGSRTPDQLKAQGISMRNLKGEFIKGNNV